MINASSDSLFRLLVNGHDRVVAFHGGIPNGSRLLRRTLVQVLGLSLPELNASPAGARCHLTLTSGLVAAFARAGESADWAHQWVHVVVDRGSQRRGSFSSSPGRDGVTMVVQLPNEVCA